MDAQTAVKAFYQQYADFKGRSGRAAFWWPVLWVFVGSIVLNVIESVIPTGGILSGLWSLAHIVPSLAVGVRRLHDTSKTGWLILLYLIPIIGFLILLFISFIKKSDPPNEYGPTPAGAEMADGASSPMDDLKGLGGIANKRAAEGRAAMDARRTTGTPETGATTTTATPTDTTPKT